MARIRLAGSAARVHAQEQVHANSRSVECSEVVGIEIVKENKAVEPASAVFYDYLAIFGRTRARVCVTVLLQDNDLRVSRPPPVCRAGVSFSAYRV